MGAKKKAGWGVVGYSTRELKKRSDKELRAEYTRLKSALRKRGKNIAASAYGSKHPMAKRLLSLPSSKGLTRAELIKALHEAGSLSLQKTSSVSGLDKAYEKSFETIYGRKPKGKFSKKKKAAGKKGGKTSGKKGKPSETEEDEVDELKNFGLFMEAYRAKFGEKNASVGSDIVASMYHDMKDAGINPNRARAHMEQWTALYMQADRQGKMLQDFVVKNSRGGTSNSSRAWRKAMNVKDLDKQRRKKKK